MSSLNFKRIFICVWVGVNLVLATALSFGQEPDRRGERVSRQSESQGQKASAPIPAALHIRNEGGSDGAGLCVISSALINGQYQNVPGIPVGHAKDSALWKLAKARKGGYSPPKLAALVNEVMPGEKFASYVGTDTSILERVSKMGYPIGATMNTGALYHYQPIHHMISLVHYDKRTACVVDNNRPGFYSWMPRAEFDRRWIDGGIGWAWIWTRLPKVEDILIGAILIKLGIVAGLIVVGNIRRLRAGS